MLPRKYEHFEQASPIGLDNAVASVPPKMFRQERDWTCSIACLRTIASKFKDVEGEDEIVRKYGLNPGPHYTDDLVKCGILDEFDFEVSSTVPPNVAEELKRVYHLLETGATVMVETCRSFDHWLVLLAYFPGGHEYTEDQYVLMWDPYYAETFLMRVSEFCDEWLSGYWESNGVACDFIAIKGMRKND